MNTQPVQDPITQYQSTTRIQEKLSTLISIFQGKIGVDDPEKLGALLRTEALADYSPLRAASVVLLGHVGKKEDISFIQQVVVNDSSKFVREAGELAIARLNLL